MATRLHDLPTPALIVDADALEHNLATMAEAKPGAANRPHVKAHKCTPLAGLQSLHGHRSFTCATPREVMGMIASSMGDDLLLANEVLDARRLMIMASLQDQAQITIAIDSDATLDAAAEAGLTRVIIDVNVGLPRCGIAPDKAGALADRARARGLTVAGVMGYEGHLMMVTDRAEKKAKVDEAVDLLLAAHADVGGEVVSSGGTGTYDLHDRVTEVQTGSYALMDTSYASLGLPFRQALHLWTTVIASTDQWAVCDGGLKSLGMDHGNPAIEGQFVWFCSDEHITFSPERDSGNAIAPVGSHVKVAPAHVDPTVAYHEYLHIVRGEEVLDTWAIDLRGW
jgi:D-threonine aldolase